MRANTKKKLVILKRVLYAVDFKQFTYLQSVKHNSRLSNRFAPRLPHTSLCLLTQRSRLSVQFFFAHQRPSPVFDRLEIVPPNKCRKTVWCDARVFGADPVGSPQSSPPLKPRKTIFHDEVSWLTYQLSPFFSLCHYVLRILWWCISIQSKRVKFGVRSKYTWGCCKIARNAGLTVN